eukprot:6213926-Pleurochrysis_carterae.AAC.1
MIAMAKCAGPHLHNGWHIEYRKTPPSPRSWKYAKQVASPKCKDDGLMLFLAGGLVNFAPQNREIATLTGSTAQMSPHRPRARHCPYHYLKIFNYFLRMGLQSGSEWVWRGFGLAKVLKRSSVSPLMGVHYSIAHTKVLGELF